MGKIKIFFGIILLFVIVYFSCDNFVARDYIFYSSPFNIKFEPEIVKPGDLLTITYDYWYNSFYYSDYEKYPLYVDGSGDLMMYSWTENKYKKCDGKIRIGVKINEEFLLKNKDKGATGELWGDDGKRSIPEIWSQFKNNVFYEEGVVIEKYISYSEEKYPETYKKFNGDMGKKIKVTIKCYVPETENASSGHIYVCYVGLPGGEAKEWYIYFSSVSIGKLIVDVSSD